MYSGVVGGFTRTDTLSCTLLPQAKQEAFGMKMAHPLFANEEGRLLMLRTRSTNVLVLNPSFALAE